MVDGDVVVVLVTMVVEIVLVILDGFVEVLEGLGEAEAVAGKH